MREPENTVNLDLLTMVDYNTKDLASLRSVVFISKKDLHQIDQGRVDVFSDFSCHTTEVTS